MKKVIWNIFVVNLCPIYNDLKQNGWKTKTKQKKDTKPTKWSELEPWGQVHKLN